MKEPGDMHLVRYELDGGIRHGILEDGSISEIEGDFFGDRRRTGAVKRSRERKVDDRRRRALPSPA